MICEQIMDSIKNFDNLQKDGIVRVGDFDISLRYDDDPVGERTFRVDCGTDRIKEIDEGNIEASRKDIQTFAQKFTCS